MMSRLMPLFMLVAACILPSSICSAKPVNRILDASVQIVVQMPLELMPVGSGTLIRDDEMGLGIITAQHVAEAFETFPYLACRLDEPLNCVELDLVVVDLGGGIESDWAFYPIDKAPQGSYPAELGPHPDLGDDLWQAGIPNGSPLVTKASVAWDQDELFVLQGFGYPGGSGGGVFDHWGRLVGITVAIPMLRDPLGFPAYETELPLVVAIENVPFLAGDRAADEG